MNPFLKTSADGTSEYVTSLGSLNRAVFAQSPLSGIEDGLEGLKFSQIFSTPLIVADIRRVSRFYRLDLSDVPDDRLPRILDEGLVSDDIRYNQMAERVVKKFGNRLGLLLLVLRTGERENRLARPEWDDSCWEYWRNIDTLILTGGLASSMLGRRFKEQIHNIFDLAGVKPYNITLFENGAYIGIMGIAQRLMGDDLCALGFDLGHTSLKRALVRMDSGIITGFTPYDTLPSRYMTSRFDTDAEKLASAKDLHNYIVKAIVSAHRELTSYADVSDTILISIANYTDNGVLDNEHGGYAKLGTLGANYASTLQETLSGELRRSIKVKLVHDATATALYFSDVPDSVCITLGTGFGVGYPDIKIR